MTTGTVLDLRRTDLRSNVLENPYWITSAELDKDADDEDAVLFSFPAISASASPSYGTNLIQVHQVAFEVTTGFVGGTLALTIGGGSIETDDITTTGVSTDVTVDRYILYDDITIATPGWYLPTTGNTSAWLTDIAAKTFSVNTTILPADATTLTVVAYLSSSAPITAGAGRFHMLISELPTCR